MGVSIVGIGMHKFGRTEGVSGLAQGAHALRAALTDAGAGFADMEFGFGGSHAAGNADAIVNHLGLTGVPVTNVRNGCAVGGTALVAARQAIESGQHRLGFVLGFDKHPKGAFNADPAAHGLPQWYGETGMMLTTQFFALKIQRYLHDHDLDPRLLSTIAAKAMRNGSLNEMAWHRTPMTEDDVAGARMVSDPLTQYMFCTPGEGAVALVLADSSIAHQYTDRPVHLKAATFRTRRFGSFEVFSPWLSPERGDSPSVDASKAAYEEAGVGPDDIDVFQLQDTETGAELMHMAECGLVEHGGQGELIARGETEITGSRPINTDGGCLANGEPIGASGLRQVHENVLQLRGEAGARQVAGNPRTAFSHVYGAPGVSACTVLST